MSTGKSGKIGQPQQNLQPEVTNAPLDCTTLRRTDEFCSCTATCTLPTSNTTSAGNCGYPDRLQSTQDAQWLSRLLHHSVDPKALADFFRESPWKIDQMSQPRKKLMLAKVLELAQAAGIVLKIMVSLDDSLGKKGKATKHLDAVDHHHNHTESTRKRPAWSNGYVYVELHVQMGPFGFLFDTRLYLREKKFRKLNRSRGKKSDCPIAVSTTWRVKCCWNWTRCCLKAARCMCCSTPRMPLPN